MAEDQGPKSTTQGNVVKLATARKSTIEQLRERRDRYFDHLNKEFCLVNDHGTGWIFQEVENQLRPGFRNIYRLKEADFKLLYKNEQLIAPVAAPRAEDFDATKLVSKSAAEWWLTSRGHRRQFRKGAEFAPGRDLPPGWYNTWTGWAVKPLKPRASNGCPLFHQHLLQIICAGDYKCYEYLLNWLARMVQQPGSPGRTIIVLAGKQGVGKGQFAKYVLTIFGVHGLHLRDPAHIHRKFNVHLQNCIFLFADEAIWAGDKTVRGILYALATEDRLPVEPKFQNLYDTSNNLHIIMASNHNWVSQVDTDDRRTVVFEVPDTRQRDNVYFDALADERDRGGAATLLWELQHRNISQFNPEEIPDTQARRRQKRFGLSTLKQYWMAALDRRFPYVSEYGVRSLEEWRPFYTTQLIWAGYNQWMDEARRYQRETEEDLGRMLTELYGNASRPRAWHPVREIKRTGHQRAVDPAQPGLRYAETEELLVGAYNLPDDPEGLVECKFHSRGYEVGDLTEARDAFDRVYGPLDTPWHA